MAHKYVQIQVDLLSILARLRSVTADLDERFFDPEQHLNVQVELD